MPTPQGFIWVYSQMGFERGKKIQGFLKATFYK
jgi:hypothetical protein